MSEQPTDLKIAIAHYFAATRSGSAEIWSACFTPDAIVDDPVGLPVAVGRDAIQTRGEEFMSQFASVGLTETFVHVFGSRAVAKWTGEGIRLDETKVTFEGINVFEFGADGLIKHLEGFWNPALLASA